MNEILHYLQSNQEALWWLTMSSLLMFFVSLAAVPFLIVRIPYDYFRYDKRQHTLWAEFHPLLRLFLIIMKNLLGLLLVMIGLMLLIMPGQGLLTILVGILFLDFPGKFKLERTIIEKKPVLKAVNWLRKKEGRKPIEVD